MQQSGKSVIKVAIEYHYVEAGGRIYTDMSFPYDYWREYLDVFDEVEVIARVGHAGAAPEGWIRADGDGVRFHEVYDYLGFWQFLRHLPRVFRDCSRAVSGSAPLLMRMGNISLICWLLSIPARRPYAIEFLGHAGMGPRTVQNVRYLGLGRFIGFLSHRLCRLQAAKAACASYVSRYTQRMYPTRSGREWIFSSVKLPETAFGRARDVVHADRRPRRLVSVGRVEPEKGHETLIRAAAELNHRGAESFQIEIAGPGSRIEALRRLAAELGVAERVTFVGRIEPGPSLHAFLDRADLFVLPSLTEGMPRAMLEAMARGLPAVGSRTGGIIELLDDESLVEPGNPRALADVIGATLSSPERLAALSRRALDRAREYRYDIMNRRKHEFWRAIRELCA